MRKRKAKPEEAKTITIDYATTATDSFPTFTYSEITTSADEVRGLFVADMDGDGDLDIVSGSATDDTIAWYENDGAANPSFTAADINTNADGAYDVFVADIDGDGDLDIISANSYEDTVTWYENDGAANPTWTAIDIANSTKYGLASGVFTADDQKAKWTADRIQAGIIWQNDWFVDGVNLPGGGYKRSGYGRDGGIDGIYSHGQTKRISQRLK